MVYTFSGPSPSGGTAYGLCVADSDGEARSIATEVLQCESDDVCLDVGTARFLLAYYNGVAFLTSKA